MLKKIVSAAFVIILGLTGSVFGAPEFIEGLTVMPTGWMKFPGGIEMGVDHFGPQWELTRQVLDSITLKRDIAEVTDKGWSIKGTFAGFDFVQTLSSICRSTAFKARFSVGTKRRLPSR
jgi:hypothetical protein